MSVKRLSIVVSGRVQGVGFRFFTTNHARKHKLSGWVRNCAGGNVEIEAQGEEENLEEFRKEVHAGPILAKVTDLTIVEIPLLQDEAYFEVRR
jgi:acylphosphatase